MVFKKANSDSDKDDVLNDHPAPKQFAEVANNNQMFDFDMSAPVVEQQNFNNNDVNNDLFQFAVDDSARGAKPIDDEPENRMQPLAQNSV